jgi:hypothetical protein
LHSMAVCLREQGKLDEALAMFREALRILEKTVGKEHPSYEATETWVEFLEEEVRPSDADLM